jgi:F-type H+-transporting ATPase subunit delta
MPLIESQPDAVARTYARSLYELADAGGGRAKVEEVLGELEDILELTRSIPSFGEFLASRSLAASARGESLKRILGGRVTQLTSNFLQVLNDKGRISALPAIATAFDSIVQEKFGRVEVDVFTATPLDPQAADGMKGRLAKALGKEVVLHPYTEPAMLGGVKFRIGDQLVDASIATRLRRVKDQIEGSGAATLRAKFKNIIQDI